MTIVWYTLLFTVVYSLLRSKSYTLIAIGIAVNIIYALSLDADIGSAYLLLDLGIISIALTIDQLSIWLIFITIICGSFIGISMITKHSFTSYIDLLLVYIITCSTIFFMAGDVLTLYLAFELITIPILLYVGMLGHSSRRTYAMASMLLVLLISSGMMLTILCLYASEFTDAQPFAISTSHTILCTDTWFLSGLVLMFFASKVPLYPLYIWLPEAHVESNSEMSILLAAIVLKFSMFGIIRMSYWLDASAANSISYLFGTLCLLGLIHASVSSIHNLDLKKLVAYSSIVHMQLGLLVIVSNDHLGYNILLFTCIVHGIVSIGLFYCIGIASESVGTRHVSFIHAGTTLTPLLSAVSLHTILLNIACPLSVAAIVELLTLLVYTQIGVIALVIGALCAIWFCTLFSLILLYRAYMNDSSWYHTDTQDMSILDSSAMMLAYASLVLGILVL